MMIFPPFQFIDFWSRHCSEMMYLLEKELEKSKLVLKTLGSEIDYLPLGNF